MTTSKVFLIGTGPLPMHSPRRMGFPALRTRQFLLPLLRAGYEVTLACLISRDDEAEATTPGEMQDIAATWAGEALSFRYVVVRPDEPGRFLALRDLRRDFKPDVTVTAGPFLPMAAGARAAGEEPLWIDVPGDPMAEAQTRAFRADSADPIHRYREMLGWALARGDRFSVISGAQRGTLIGALGLAGRLTQDTVGHEFVQVLPGSVEGLYRDGKEAKSGHADLLEALPREAYVVLFCGGYNTWLDGDTLLDGLLRAMDRDPSLHFVSTGGALRGHDEASYRDFVERASSSPHANRFHFLGWIASPLLPSIFERAQLSIFLDLPCYEAEFGARTRILECLEHGVPVAATDSCDLTHELAGTDFFHGLPLGQAEAVADLLLRLSKAHRSDRQEGPAQRAVPWEDLRQRYSLDCTTGELLAWLREPMRSPGGVPIDFLEDYWQELARLQDRLEEVWDSPTWRYLGRAHRLLSRFRGGSGEA